ncbi:MAG: shikimate dehydrogenase [Candidatus Abyssobacteria bacterium SURF_5]|uniref:Shikimate dehydrogenase (NADP(+)) n=1 Tax=Abyssobacteria bacterium (strain SURF_5) TaxID=2093360 RepID=A0A3A4NII8_ABYX5|nr:MAG: shikimate dehydrogenase [Candidatus Abyssubacteria bacterium SURF_5]
MKHIDAGTKVCAVIGNPVEHSLSPAIHNAAFDALGLNYAYVAFRVENIAGAVAGLRALGNFRGLSVTIPHKVSIMQYLDEIDEITRSIGSVNTVVKEDGILRGTSTDGPGAAKALADAGIEIEGRRILMLGSGGAARSIAFALATRKCPRDLTILGVIPAELEKLVNDLREKTAAQVEGALLDDSSLRRNIGPADIVIHCTPVGMNPRTEASLVPKEVLRAGQVVFDIVYTPRKTRLLRDAETAGCTIVPGLEMFVNQAVLQFELWTGKQAPVEIMRKVVERHLG